VLADPGQMEQVAMNLILNARDAIPTGGWIRVETENCEFQETNAQIHHVSPGPYGLLSVTDNGPRVDNASMSKIYEPFSTTKEAGKGTGLGLSTVHGIVKQIGGDIWVCSAPGEGACFRVCLPRASRETEVEPIHQAHAETGPARETVLLAEDEEGVRRLLTH